MVRALRDHGYVVVTTEGDFLKDWTVQDCDIVTNPPYGKLAEEVCASRPRCDVAPQGQGGDAAADGVGRGKDAA